MTPDDILIVAGIGAQHICWRVAARVGRATTSETPGRPLALDENTTIQSGTA